MIGIQLPFRLRYTNLDTVSFTGPRGCHVNVSTIPRC
jgi:hypothetical protein